MQEGQGSLAVNVGINWRYLIAVWEGRVPWLPEFCLGTTGMEAQGQAGCCCCCHRAGFHEIEAMGKQTIGILRGCSLVATEGYHKEAYHKPWQFCECNAA